MELALWISSSAVRTKLALRKVLAFLKRDFRINASYKLAFSYQFFGVFFQLTLFYFISKVFRGAIAPYLRGYGGDYFSFVLIGIAFSGYLRVGLTSFSGSIREAQMRGTLEALLATPTSISLIIFASSLWPFIWTTFNVLVYITFGVLVFKATLNLGSLLGAFLILVLTVIAHSAIGILSASFVVVFKRGNPIDWLIGIGSTLLGGIYYPVEALPSWLRGVASLLPITHSLKGMRGAILQGLSLSEVLGDIFFLLVFSMVLLPLAVFVFGKALNKAKRDGSLTHY